MPTPTKKRRGMQPLHMARALDSLDSSFRIVPRVFEDGWSAYVDVAYALPDSPGTVTISAGNGRTPYAAVRDLWAQYTTLLDEKGGYIILKRGKSRRYLRWNGFMWEDAKDRRDAAVKAREEQNK